ncbi:MAG: MerR family transcriptional regulator [Actinomycetota bacterium]|nr:MerR family transcriptional regulator [Actinomycetota bacterium]
MDSMVIKRFYGSLEVCRIIGITYKQLDYYDRTGFVKPSVNGAGGYGSRRMYDFNDLMKLKVIKKLMEAGISLQKLRRTKKYLDEYDNNTAAGNGLLKLTLISDGNTVYACDSDKAIVDTLKSGQGVFGIALGRVYNDLNGDIEKYFMKNSIKKTGTAINSESYK